MGAAGTETVSGLLADEGVQATRTATRIMKGRLILGALAFSNSKTKQNSIESEVGVGLGCVRLPWTTSHVGLGSAPIACRHRRHSTRVPCQRPSVRLRPGCAPTDLAMIPLSTRCPGFVDCVACAIGSSFLLYPGHLLGRALPLSSRQCSHIQPPALPSPSR